MASIDFDSNPSPEGSAIGAYPFQLESDPMVAVPRVRIEHVAVVITRIGPSHYLINVLLSVVVEIATGHAFDEANDSDALGSGAFGERAVAIVAEQLAGRRFLAC